MSIAALARRGFAFAHAKARGYQVVSEPKASTEFLNALHELTKTDAVGRRVYRVLAEPTRVPKQHILVLHKSEPVLAITLRRRADFWEPATANVAPQLRLPHRTGHLDGALSASFQDIEIPEYFGDPADFEASRTTAFTIYVASLQEPHYSKHWSKHLKGNIARDARNANLEVVVDDPAALGWLIDRWYENWRGHPADEICACDDLRAVWPELLSQGQLKTVTLTREQQPVAAQAAAVHGSTVAVLVVARDKQWIGSQSLGTLAAVEMMNAARAAGFERYDFGGYFDEYKSRLAPAGGTRHTVRFRPKFPRWIEMQGDRT